MKKLISLALLLSFSSIYSQNTTTKTIVKEFKIETNNVDALKKFKWEKVENFFEQNNKSDSIKIVLILRNDSTNKKVDIQLNNIITEIKGQTFELHKLIRKAKKMTKEMIETYKELNR